MNDWTSERIESLERELVAMQGRERRYRGLFDSMIEGFGLAEILLDEQERPYDYRLLEVNEAFSRLTGHAIDEAHGKSARELLPDFVGKWLDTFAEVALAGRPARFESYIEGLGQWFDVVAYQTAPGEFAHLFVDITTRKRSEEALRQSRTMLEEAEKLSHTGAWEWDISADQLTFSEAWCAIHGVSRRILTPEELLPIAHPDDRAAIGEAFERVRRGIAPYDMEHRIVRQDNGEVRTVRARGDFVRDEKGRVVRVYGFAKDITEEKRSQEALRQSEERYRRQATELDTIYRRAPIGLCVFDRELRFERINERLAEINGIPAEEHIGKTPREVVPGLADQAEELARRIFETGEPALNIEIQGETPAQPGVARSWIEHWLPLQGGTENAWGINVVVEEITERKRMEALRRREVEFRTLAENSPDIVARIDPDHRHVYINPAVESITGIPREAFAGKSSVEIGFSEEASAAWEAGLSRVFSGGTAETLDLRLSTREGERQVESHLVPEFTPDGKIETVLAITRDVTDSRTMEAALRQQAAMLESILDNIPVMIAFYDAPNRVMRLNHYCEEVTGWTSEEANRVDLLAELYPEPDYRQKVIDYMNHPTVEWRPLRLKTRQGDEVESAWSNVALPDGSNIGIGIDLRERLQYEAELRRSKEALQATLDELRTTQQQIIQSEKLAALGTMAAGVAHEISNPLMGIFNYIAFARQRVEDPELKYPLERAEQELRRVRDLLKGMLTFARPSKRSVTAVDLATVFRQTVGLVAPEFRARQVDFSTDIPEDLPKVLGNEEPLQQVFLNLLLNARDAVEESSEKRVNLRARPTEEAVSVEVTDSGEGIPEAIRGRIYDPFFSTKPPGKGTGLGLSIVRTVITELGGRIEVFSEPGAGARFVVTLPVASAPDNRIRGES